MKVVERMLEWENAGKIDLLKTGYSLRAPELLFRKIEDEEIQTQMEKLHQNSIKPQVKQKAEPVIAVPERKPEIQYEDFAKLDLRTGIITTGRKSTQGR